MIEDTLENAANTNLYNLLTSNAIHAMLNYPVDAARMPLDLENLAETTESYLTKIVNARKLESQPSLAKEGFCLVSENISFNHPHDKEKLNADSLIIQNILENHINAKGSLLLGHVIRDEVIGLRDEPQAKRPPAYFVHTDWSSARIKTLAEASDPYVVTSAAVTTKEIGQFIKNSSRWALYNVWRPLKTVINLPLALCDVNTVESNNIIKNVGFKTSYQDNKTITDLIMTLQHKPIYRWLYYPLMQSNELLIFRQFDSIQEIDNFIPVFHTAFNLLTNKNIMLETRESIEFRFLVRL